MSEDDEFINHHQLLAEGWLHKSKRHQQVLPHYWKWGLFELKAAGCVIYGHEDWIDDLADGDLGFRFNDDYPTGGDGVYVGVVEESRLFRAVPTTCVLCECREVAHPLEIEDLSLQSQCCDVCWSELWGQ